ncbi:hypothetical protein QE436_001495 [Pantoea anthophila]|nr:hypothetical protein [Pantoea anthophila]
MAVLWYQYRSLVSNDRTNHASPRFVQRLQRRCFILEKGAEF